MCRLRGTARRTIPRRRAACPGRAAVKAPASGWIDKVALALRNHPQAEVQVVSDSDGSGSESAAKALALDRAASARDWMVARGVPATRIAIASRGTRPGATDPRRLDILIGERAPTVAR